MTHAIVSHYEVINRRTGIVKTYKTRATATRAADRADMAYGAVCCTVRTIWVNN